MIARFPPQAGLVVAGLLAICAPAGSRGPEAPPPGEARLEALVEANIAGVHAYQILLARKEGKGDPACWPRDAPPSTVLESLLAHQTSLLAGPPAAAKAWASGEPSSFDPEKDLKPLLAASLPMPPSLPVNVFADYLAAQAPGRTRAEVRAVANLYQTVLEVERDGDRLQELFAFDIGIGLPVYVGQFGLPGTDLDFLAAGRTLEGRSCASPVGLSAAEWQLAGRKIWNWGEKNEHIRDAQVLAGELLAEPDVKALVPRMRALPPERVAIIGHSFTMDLHWSSPSAFVPIVTAMFARENPGVLFRQFQGGGLTSSRAYRNFYRDALGWKPDTVLLVVLNRTDEDLSLLKEMGQGFKAEGARVLVFDDVRDPDATDPAKLRKEAAAAREGGITVVEVGKVLAASKDQPRFLCLDHMHMTEPYHRLMAKEWLKVLVGGPGAVGED
jgi:hypothetical protein